MWRGYCLIPENSGRAAEWMYLNLGQDVVVPSRAIVSVIDMDTATWSKHTRTFIAELEKKHCVVPVFDDLPKSGVLCVERGEVRLYISQLSTATLLRRSG